MLKSESAVEIRLEKHLSRRGQLVIYGYCQVTSNLVVLPRGHQLMLSLVYLISCCSPNFQLRDWSVQSCPSALLVCALISPQALRLSYSMFIVSKKLQYFFGQKSSDLLAKNLDMFCHPTFCPSSTFDQSLCSCCKMVPIFHLVVWFCHNYWHFWGKTPVILSWSPWKWLCFFVIYIHQKVIIHLDASFLKHAEKNYFRYSWLDSYPHRCSNDDHSCQAAQNWAHPDTPGTQSYVLSSIHNISGLKKDIYVIISDIDHLLLLLTVAFAETIPLLSVSMSSRSSIVLPSLDWLLSKELSLHALSRVIKLDQFSRPTSLHRKYLSNTLTPMESYRKMKRFQPTTLFHLSNFTFYFQEPGPSSLH